MVYAWPVVGRAKATSRKEARMPWSSDDALRAEEDLRNAPLDLYEAGKYRELADAYCHEGWGVSRRDTGAIIDAGICSVRVEGMTEEAALVLVAGHIKAQIEAGVLGC